jgi:hypothetical protein
MKRRTVLSTLGLSLFGGCVGNPLQPAEEYTPTSIAEVQGDEVPESEDVALELELERDFSESAPARLSISFTNTADQTRTFEFGGTPPFSSFHGTAVGGNAQMILVPDDFEYVGIVSYDDSTVETVVPSQPIEGCWKAVNGIVGNDIILDRELGPDESISMTYTVVAHHENDACLEPGEYRFVSQNYFSNGSSWGLTVTVKKPEDETGSPS